jgi:outer membrane protein insertion porin family
VDVKGDEFLDKASARESFKLKSGETFDRSLMTEDIDILTKRYANNGFFYANVTPLTDVDDARHTVAITYDVTKGQLVYFEDIEVVGNVKTRDHVIRRHTLPAEGELFNARAVEQTKDRVKSLGFFDDVTVNTRVGSTANQVDLTVGVKERPTGSFSFGAGFSSVDEFIFAAQIQQLNLFGRGQQLASRRTSADARSDLTSASAIPSWAGRSGRWGSTRSSTAGTSTTSRGAAGGAGSPWATRSSSSPGCSSATPSRTRR